MILLDLGGQVHLLMQALLGFLDTQPGDFLCLFPFQTVFGQFFGGCRPLRQLPLQLHQAGFKLAARFATVADFRFQPGDLGIGRVHLALCVVQRIASGKMRFPGFLGARLGFPQRGALRLKVGRRPLDFQRQALALAFGFAFAQQPQQLLALGQLLVQGMVAAGHLGLRFEALDLVTEFFANVLDAEQVLAGIFEAPLRSPCAAPCSLVTPAASSRNTRRSSGLASMMREIMPWPMMA